MCSFYKAMSMYPPSSLSDIRTRLHDKLDTLLDESEQIMDNARYERIFHDLDDFFCIRRQEFLREHFDKNFRNTLQKPKPSRLNNDRMNGKKIIAIFSISVGRLIISFFILYVFLYCLIGYSAWKTEQGHDQKGATRKWYRAMIDGDGKEALFWAKKAASYYGLQDIVYHQLALAYELNGQYDIAIYYYKLVEHLYFPKKQCG